MENSGIDMCWVEAELYFTLTVRQILDGNQELHETLQSLAQDLCDACKDSTRTQLKKAQVEMVSAIGNLNILEKMSTFEAANTSNPMFKVIRHYMRMVMEMLVFIRAVRTGDWSLHGTPDNSRDVHQVLLSPMTKYTMHL